MVRDSEIHLIKPLRQEAGFFTALHSFPAFKGLHKSYEIWVSYFPFSMVPLPPKNPGRPPQPLGRPIRRQSQPENLEKLNQSRNRGKLPPPGNIRYASLNRSSEIRPPFKLFEI